jgi:hypothetical protein
MLKVASFMPRLRTALAVLSSNVTTLKARNLYRSGLLPNRKPSVAIAMKQLGRAADRERRLLRQIAGNLSMGAALGACFALWLLLTNVQGISTVIAGSDAPVIMRAIFVIGLAAHFGFAAALTAFVMLMSED